MLRWQLPQQSCSFMKPIYVALMFLGLTGCATSEKFSAKMDGFIGQPEISVISTYGIPQSNYTLQDGSRVIQYTRGSDITLPGAITVQPVTTNTSGNLTLNQGIRQTTGSYAQQSTTYVQSQGPASNISFSCTVMFTLDANGIVRRWSAKGNHCISQ